MTGSTAPPTSPERQPRRESVHAEFSGHDQVESEKMQRFFRSTSKRILRTGFLLGIFCGLAVRPAQGAPNAAFSETRINFGTVRQGEVPVQSVAISNDGDSRPDVLMSGRCLR